MIRVAVVGIGAMGQGIVRLLSRARDMKIVGVADTNPLVLESIKPYIPHDAIVTTNSFDLLASRPDVLVEATGTIMEAFSLIIQALELKIHVVLMNSEVDQAFGRLLAEKAKKNGVTLTSDAGDQHGVLVRLINEVRMMNFDIVLAGNNKGFLNRYATVESIIAEASKRHLSPRQCVAYTDGTKLAIEMALVANANGFGLLQPGMAGPRATRLEESMKLFDLRRARELGGVVDYVIGANPGGSVFLIGYSDDPADRFYMDYYKMGEGPFYFFMRPYHLCHFETPFAIREAVDRKAILTQKRRVLEVGCRAKSDLSPGVKLEGIGGRHVYGVLEEAGGLPVVLAGGTVLKRPKRKDESITWEDVSYPKDDSRFVVWEEQHKLDS